VNNLETRKHNISVFGWELYFMGALIAHKSKTCRSVTLSSTEVECYALSEVTKEVTFTKQVLETMIIGLDLPIKIKVDNVGAIYQAKNFSLSQNTKHIDIHQQLTQCFSVCMMTKQSSSQRIHQKRYSCITIANERCY
jgi:hypothetical protein